MSFKRGEERYTYQTQERDGKKKRTVSLRPTSEMTTPQFPQNVSRGLSLIDSVTNVCTVQSTSLVLPLSTVMGLWYGKNVRIFNEDTAYL